ncbi:MAG: phosphate signaling complex protein PhoU [Actinomycetota bacterium]
MTGRKTFQVQLAEAEGLVVETAGLVLQQLERTIGALGSRDESLAGDVIDNDDPVDERYLEIEERILTLLATQAPVASDLRLVSAMLHINIHLERVADLCVNIAKFVKLARDLPRSPEIVQELVEMTRQAALMLETAIRAFSERDLQLALGLPRMDDRIDRLNRELFKQASHWSTDENAIEWGSRMILASRQVERMGDHAVDIGEQVAFMITGEFREFTDASAKADV